MKNIYLIIMLLCSQAVFAQTQCGDDRNERRYPSLDWVKATNYKAISSFITIKGILCAGIDRRSNTLKRIHYRDNTGTAVQTTLTSLKQRDITFIRRSDFPAVARIVTRNVDPLTIKVNKEDIKYQYTDYKLSLKFVRNMGRGFSKTDIRDLQVAGRLYKNGRFDIYYGERPTSRNTFDKIILNIAGDLKVNTVKFYDGQSFINSLSSSKLPKSNRK